MGNITGDFRKFIKRKLTKWCVEGEEWIEYQQEDLASE